LATKAFQAKTATRKGCRFSFLRRKVHVPAKCRRSVVVPTYFTTPSRRLEEVPWPNPTTSSRSAKETLREKLRGEKTDARSWPPKQATLPSKMSR